MDSPLIVIVGPTGVGKTEVSIYLAKKMNGEIISADSRTFYRGMDIGTAKPTKEELKLIPHHLVDIADPDQHLNLAVFQQHVDAIIGEIRTRHHIPFLVGGTGQYIRAITNNWSPPTISPDPRLRIIFEELANEKGKDFLHQALRRLDPEAAKIIDPRNLRRTIRALEVIFSTGKRFSSQRIKKPGPNNFIVVGLTRPRLELYARIDRRIDEMFTKGLINEVRSLLSAGYSPDLPSFSAIGYSECINVIAGNFDELDAIEEIKRKTRIYVRRQTNWFKPSDPNIHWFDISSHPLYEIEKFLRSEINSPINT